MSAVRRRAAVTLALLALLVAPTVLVGSAQAAPVASAATRCGVDPTDAEAVTEAAEGVDEVFVGEVAETDRRSVPASGRRIVVWRYRMAVEAGFQGVLGSGNSVWVLLTDQTRARDRLRLGDTYLVFATESGNQLLTETCGLTRLPGGLDDDTDAALTATLSPADPAPLDPTLTPVDGADSDSPPLSRAVAPGLAIGLVGLLGLVLVSRLGRR